MTFRIGDWRIEPALDEIARDGKTVKLEPRTMRVLVCLAEHAGEVMSVEQLLDAVWKDVVVTPESVYQAVAGLRRALGDDPKEPMYIGNVLRRGYRLLAPVAPWIEAAVDVEPAPGPPELPIDVRALHTTDLDEWLRDDRSPQVQEVLHALGAIIARERAPRPATAKFPPIIPAPVASDTGRIAICVLPFANMSGDPGQEYFSDGITEDIITELSRWRLFSVRSRSASFRYRGLAVDMKQVARELDVRFVVEGSVRRMGERIRTSVQLIDAETGSHVWSERFDRALDEIFAVQDRVVQTIVSTLVGRVQVSDVERARRKPPASLAAYECVLKANALSWDDPDGAAEAMQLVKKAIELDPGYGFAHALLASLLQRQWSDDPGDSDAALEEAYALAMRAVELDDGESTCHAILGHICLQRGSFELALQYARRAVEINPNNQWNAADLGSILIYVGESEEALTWFTRAREIDPYFDQPWYWRAVGLAYMNMHRYADALSKLSHARIHPYWSVALMTGCHAQLGDMDRARASAAECLSMRPDFSITRFMRKEPFKSPAEAEQLASSLRLAGLPD